MEHLTDAARQAVVQGNWYAALTVALTLPDICGALASPEERSKARYIAWCDTYLTPRYTHQVGADLQSHVFLRGTDCYALRCAVLHEGVDTISERHSARKALDAYRFVAPPRGGGSIHCNQFNSMLQLQVDVFCEDVCKGVDQWRQLVPFVDSDVPTRINTMMKIQPPGSGFSL